ncbi:hypothetical protein [Scytonema hofmannii]|nr:hypothetical protein [Scytonema hofmannii]
MDIYQKQLPEIILLNAVIPGIDGLACCNRLQARLGNNCPFILRAGSH